MKRTIDTERLPIKLWLDDIEPGALAQARNLANLPFAFQWIAVMPDCHQGYGMPIGGVLAARDVVVPNAVGVDIGCGVCAVRTSLREIDREALKTVMAGIRSRVPLGFAHHKHRVEWSGFDSAPDVRIIQQELDAARFQLGTLGGGNHFIELQRGPGGAVWIMLHSGSRNFGLKVAEEYHRQARRLCQSRGYALPDPDLAYLPMDCREATDYLAAMDFALDFARENRFRMVDAAKQALLDVLPVSFGETVNIHHNYAAVETHYGAEVVVHRKGATAAAAGQTGLVPGSQGAPSYVVRGRGNPESFMSCSHGAGRRMGRNQARRQLDLEQEQRQLDERGIIHSLRGVRDLDEAAGAYKDIAQVMRDQEDLVEVVAELTPLAVIKG
ncbi:MAG: RtcB family protein [Rhodocyclaceae bacterium]|nr:RtcB family protein [Rhodocyclaceae bacterium]